MLYEPKDARVGVEVDYFDEGHGKFTITYDGLTGNFTDGEIVQLEDTGEWKTHTFYLYDAEFANGFWLPEEHGISESGKGRRSWE